MGKTAIEQNCIMMFDPKDPLAIIIRCCLFFQIFVAMSLLFACQRAQILLLMYGKQEVDSLRLTIFINCCILVLPFLLSVFYPNVGVLAGYLGSVSALFCIYILPIATYLKYKYTEIKAPLLVKAIKENEYSYDSKIMASP